MKIMFYTGKTANKSGQKIKKKRRKIATLTSVIVVLLSTVIGIAYIAASASETVTTTTVCIEDKVCKAQNRNITVPIMINNVKKVAYANICLKYDPSVVHVIDFNNSDFKEEISETIDNVAGYACYEVMQWPPKPDDYDNVTFAKVTLKAECNHTGEVSPLNLTVISLQDGMGDSITYNVSNGTFTVAALVSIPKNINVSRNETYTTNITIDVKDVKGANICLKYDPSVVHVIDFKDSDFSMPVSKTIDNVAGYSCYAVVSFEALSGKNIKFADVTLKAVGNPCRSSLLNLTVKSLNTGTDEIQREVDNGTFEIRCCNISVANPTANPQIIPDDTDGMPMPEVDNPKCWNWSYTDKRWETSQLNVTITEADDEGCIESVTINLSAIGGSPAQEMTNIPGTEIWTVIINASKGTALWNDTNNTYEPHRLEINVTDINGDSTFTFLELTVENNGDVDNNGETNLDDGIYLVCWALNVPGYDIPEEKLVLADVDGNGEVNLDDGIYLVCWALKVEGYEVLH